MVNLRKKFFILAFLAASIFLSAFLGGEFLHQHIHHHQTKASHDDCPIYQLLVQTFLVVLAAALCLRKTPVYKTSIIDEVLISFQKYFLPLLRAPPVSF